MRSAPDRAGLDLAALQRWFLEHVASSRPDAGPPAGPAVDDVILPSRTLDAAARLRIYSRMYLQRLREVMAREHAVIERIVGEEAFTGMVHDYVRRFPSRSFTLNDLARAFPRYLRDFVERDDLPVLLDVARLERALSDAHDTPSYGRIGPDALAAIPAEAWAGVRLRLDPSVRVLAFEHDACAIVDAAREGRELPALAPKPSWAVVWRSDKVWRRPLSRARHAILAALARGETMAVALERAAAAWDGDDAELEARIFEWFADWLREGYVSAVVLPRS